MVMIEHSDRIVIWGMSCVGKTTFAQQIPRPYICFDALFPWHMMETLGLSFEAAMQEVKSVCEANPKFVLDGWHLGDEQGEFLPGGVTCYVLYANYEEIIAQYRVPVADLEQHRGMFQKWYQIKYPAFKSVRYFKNAGSFVETSEGEFLTFLEQSQ